MTDANNIRKTLTLLEAAIPDYQGSKASPDISYSAEGSGGKISKVIAVLRSYDSGRYTKLGRNLLRIKALTEKIKMLQEQTKGETRELIADLFNAEDVAYTRVVETVGFTFQLTKDPTPVSSVSYSKVLKELEDHLTPDLIKVLEELKAKHTSAPVQKAAGLSATDKRAPTGESINEGIMDKLTGFFKKLYQEVKAWGVHYDSQLDALRAEVGLTESLDEDWADDRQAFYKEISTAIRMPLDDLLIDAIQGACVTQSEWAESKADCIQRIYGALEELSNSDFMQEEAMELKVGDTVEVTSEVSMAYGHTGEIIDIMPHGFKVKFKNGKTGLFTDDDLESVATEAKEEKEECDHEWHEGVDDNGELVEPPYDICVHCGAVRH